jgi:multiple sugar transport system ATP-binding protein
VQLDSTATECVDRNCVLGLRPEAIRFVDADTAGAIPVVIEAETPLNEKAVTLAQTAGGREILISRPASSKGPAESHAYIIFDSKNVMLFDRASGERIGRHQAGNLASNLAGGQAA